MPTLHPHTGLAAILITPLLLVSDLFVSPALSFTIFASLLHVTAVIFTIIVLLYHTKSTQILCAFIVLSAFLKFFDHIESIRFLYVICLFSLFAAAGYCIRIYYRDLFIKSVFILIILAFIVALIQLLGLFDFAYLWSSHAIIENGKQFHIITTPSFLNKVEEMPTLSFVQFRPSSIFPSNQLYALFIVFICAFFLVSIQRQDSKIKILAIFIGASATLSMSKFAIFGTILLVCVSFILIEGSRKKALHIVLGLCISMLLYRLFFPGAFISAINTDLIFKSIMLRSIDIFGAIQEYIPPQIQVPTLSLETAPDLQKSYTATLNHVEKNTSSGLSTLSMIIKYPLYSCLILFLALVACILNRKQSTTTIPKSDLILWTCFIMAALVNNWTASSIFWHWFGFGAGFLFSGFIDEQPKKCPFSYKNKPKLVQ